jgi:hypothetical protein
MEKINERVSVVTVYNRDKGITMPRKMRWQGRDYLMVKLANHHKIRLGRTIIHIFHVTDGHIDFRLSFDTDSLIWTLDELYDESSAR